MHNNDNKSLAICLSMWLCPMIDRWLQFCKIMLKQLISLIMCLHKFIPVKTDYRLVNKNKFTWLHYLDQIQCYFHVKTLFLCHQCSKSLDTLYKMFSAIREVSMKQSVSALMPPLKPAFHCPSKAQKSPNCSPEKILLPKTIYTSGEYLARVQILVFMYSRKGHSKILKKFGTKRYFIG